MKHLVIAVLMLFAATIAWPQASNTTVRGTVSDQGQAIIPNATVTLTNTATNVSRATVSNEAGLYVFPGVTPGPYRISAEFSGMQKFEGNLTVQVQQDPVVDIVLQVGGTTTTVEVQDVTPMVRMDSPSLGMSLERQRIEQLPVNGIRPDDHDLQLAPPAAVVPRRSQYGRPGKNKSGRKVPV
jgi:hypothetical protein